MLRKSLVALAGAASIAAGIALPLAVAEASPSGYAYNPYKHGHPNAYQYSKPNWTPHYGTHCRWVKQPIRYRSWHPWYGWVWHTSWKNKRVCW
ncbi:MAG: hypothetical protein VX871_08600 [Pseudomonadota bacterium]|nr:hypothetical protein [Pseudomonadota bacterium]